MTLNANALELLAPAKDAAIGKIAIDHGADAVYIGGPAYGAREKAGNSLLEIESLANYAHRYHARLYLTLNTLLFDEELENARKIAWQAYEAGVDALIVQDMGLLELDLPLIDLHASTQCDVRTPEKVALLDSLGFSQIVLARELTCEEIKACKTRTQRARLEYFVHGALCVSYSGQCYLSAATTGRSANRGACSQACRLPYNLLNFEGKELLHQKHVLSLKDNDQSDHLLPLIQAGVRSFKIEGRLKDASYVKNITAYYRQKIDNIIEHEHYERTSLGLSTFSFEPNPVKTFHRGKTDYFFSGRQTNLACMDTPKSIGEKVGNVSQINRHENSLTIKVLKGVTLQNADGFVYFDNDKNLCGLHGNRVIPIKDDSIRLESFTSLKLHNNLTSGVTLFRNKDHTFLKCLEGQTAERKIPLDLTLKVGKESLSLVAKVSERSHVKSIPYQARIAKNEKALECIKKALSKTGDTIFKLENFKLDNDFVPFIPVSVLNDLRRGLLSELENTLLLHHERPSRLPRIPFKGKLTFAQDYRANVTNKKAKTFWETLGVKIQEDAFEIAKNAKGKELMRCRYCIRHEMGLCPRLLKGNPEAKNAFKEENAGHLKPEPLTLINPAGDTLLARFDCKNCEMTIEKVQVYFNLALQSERPALFHRSKQCEDLKQNKTSKVPPKQTFHTEPFSPKAS